MNETAIKLLNLLRREYSLYSVIGTKTRTEHDQKELASIDNQIIKALKDHFNTRTGSNILTHLESPSDKPPTAQSKIWYHYNIATDKMETMVTDISDVQPAKPEVKETQILDYTENFKQATKGDDFEETDDTLPTAGIHIKGHGNAIEIHASTMEEAQELRDSILYLIEQDKIASDENYGIPMYMDPNTLEVSEPKWIDWEGGECPVHPYAEVQVELRNGKTNANMALVFDWGYTGKDIGDITRYRVLSEPVNIEPQKSQNQLDAEALKDLKEVLSKHKLMIDHHEGSMRILRKPSIEAKSKIILNHRFSWLDWNNVPSGSHKV